MSMLLSDFDFHLPPDLIAQKPASQRDASPLMPVDGRTGALGEMSFSSIAALFREGDLLVLNDTRVIPARLKGNKESGGQAEVFLVRRETLPGEVWHCLIRASKPPRSGSRI